MSEDTKTVAEPEDDAAVVYDEAAEEKAQEKLVSDVTKMLESDKDKSDEKSEDTAGETGEKPPKGEASKAETEPKDEKPAELNDELQARAEGAGISKELAQRLHQSGQLEETIAAFDRKLIERFSKEETEPERREGKAPEKPPQKEPKAKDQSAESSEDAPELDPEVYDETLVKRDAYQTRRIDDLEAQIAELVQERHSAFDERFDGMVDGLGHEDLFGKGDTLPKDKQANRDTLFRAYKAVCMAHDVDSNGCDAQWGKRAMAAMFPDEVFKKAQQQTVDRLRDAEGKFLSSSKPKGAPPAKGATEEEVHGQLVSDVTTYLEKKGVQMSGV